MENSFGGNLCRCTGYRPIMAAFKTLCSDADSVNSYPDIEDIKVCAKDGKCDKPCKELCTPSKLTVYNVKGTGKWYKVSSIKEIFEVWDTVKTDSYMLVCGNTAHGKNI